MAGSSVASSRTGIGLRDRRVWIGLLILIALVAPLVVDSYIVYFIALAAVSAIVAIGLNLLMGYAGQISIGHNGFYAIGAFIAAFLIVRQGIHWIVAWPVAALVTALIGLLLGIPALRLSGLYLAVATLGFGVAIPQALLAWEGFSGGNMGLPVPRPALGGFEFTTDTSFYYLALAILLLMLWLAWNLINSKTGRAFIALRDSETAAQAMGVNLAGYKTLAFAISAGYTGLAGAIFASLVGHIVPEAFTLLQSIQFLTFIVIGGMASIPGSLAGAAFLTALPLVTNNIQLATGFKNLQQIILGLCLILVVLFLPGGLAELGARIRHAIWRRRRRSDEPEPALAELAPVLRPDE